MNGAIRWLTSLSVLGLVLYWIEPPRIAAQVQSLHPGWLVLALTVTVLQTALSAWRWRFTAGRLGLSLSWRRALGDYYLACFANQALPGGVLGDAWRAQRHARSSGRLGAAWQAVILERASGQVLVALFSLLALALMPTWRHALASSAISSGPWLVLALIILVIVGSIVLRVVLQRWPEAVASFSEAMQLAVLARKAWPWQLFSSLLIVASYALVFALAARAIGVVLHWDLLMLVALPVLLAMLIPLSVAGWGWREAMAAALWFSLGQSPEQGIAVSIAYGAIVAVGATPGILVWLRRPSPSSIPCPSSD
jgi:uncharacterized protein (TIRG00374 family)